MTHERGTNLDLLCSVAVNESTRSSCCATPTFVDRDKNETDADKEEHVTPAKSMGLDDVGDGSLRLVRVTRCNEQRLDLEFVSPEATFVVPFMKGESREVLVRRRDACKEKISTTDLPERKRRHTVHRDVVLCEWDMKRAIVDIDLATWRCVHNTKIQKKYVRGSLMLTENRRTCVHWRDTLCRNCSFKDRWHAGCLHVKWIYDMRYNNCNSMLPRQQDFLDLNPVALPMCLPACRPTRSVIVARHLL